MSDYRRNLGKSGEDEATDFLQSIGYRVLERNYRAHRGEIDIIASDGDAIIFVEVKTKKTEGFGNPEDWVGLKKQAQIGKVALAYLQENDLFDKDCRFDVIAIDRAGQNEELRHIKDAFRMDPTQFERQP